MSNIKSISIIGAGSWGTTIAILLASKNIYEVTLWAAFEEHASSMHLDRENKDFLPGYSLPESLLITSSIEDALQAELVIIAVPVQFMRSVLGNIHKSGIDLSKKIFLSVCKGIELSSLKTPFEIIQEELSIAPEKVAVLSGPTIAREVARGVPTVAAVASLDENDAVKIQEIFDGTTLRAYRNPDVVGVEHAGALKNVIAIACGISDGLGFGTNTKSALVTRGLREIINFAKIYNVQEDTFWGVTGIGDLCTTCFSPESRNRSLGEKIGKGQTLDEVLSGMKMVAEGVVTAKSVYMIANEHNIDMPIVTEVYKVLYENKSPLEAVKDLMHRPLKAE